MATSEDETTVEDLNLAQECSAELNPVADSVVNSAGDPADEADDGSDNTIKDNKIEVKGLEVKEDTMQHLFAVPDIPLSTKADQLSKKSDSSKQNGENKSNHLKDNGPLSEESKNKAVSSHQVLNKLPEGKKCKFPYTPPPWGGAPSNGVKYSLTILKEGIIRDTIDLSRKNTLTFGRHATACDVLIEHPSCSRYHAVLQYCVQESGVRMTGYYLYDMGSTHGCYVNKERMRPKVYVRIRVGYQIKFGGSSRRYIMEGPVEDQEDEGDIEEVRKIQEQRKQSKKSTNGSSEPQSDSDGASWGFGEDAAEEELDLKALMEKKKTIEVKDPKKTLKGFFEREGLDFEYEMSERGRGNSIVHVAQVHLPIESSLGNEIIAEGTSSNKKDAVLNCAMDACKIIQAYDMMQNPLREGELEKRQRQLEENDFYDSDDDNYLDRTGSIERKRLKRKKFAGKLETVEVQTHDSLKEELSEKKKALASLEQKLAMAMESDDTEEADTLDTFMANIENKLDKKEINQLKRHIIDMKKDIGKIEKLVEKTVPALPVLNVQNPKQNEKASMKNEESVVVDETGKESCRVESTKTTCNLIEQCAEKEDQKNRGNIHPKKKKKRLCGPNPKAPANVRDALEGEKEKELTEWQPPEGQTGDGRTHLNDKLGY